MSKPQKSVLPPSKHRTLNQSNPTLEYPYEYQWRDYRLAKDRIEQTIVPMLFSAAIQRDKLLDQVRQLKKALELLW